MRGDMASSSFTAVMKIYCFMMGTVVFFCIMGFVSKLSKTVIGNRNKINWDEKKNGDFIY